MKRISGALIALAMAFAVPAQADSIKVVVPFAAGGPVDMYARLVSQEMQARLKTDVVVEDRGGAGGVLGTELVSRAAPDGKTLLFGSSGSHIISAALRPGLSYDPVKNFAPISIIASAPQVIITSPEFPAKTMAELMSLAKKDPGKYSYAGMSIGFGQLTAERFFKLGLKVDMVRVPFQGAAPLITSTMGNHTPIAFIALPPAAPLIKDGKLRALAVTSKTRWPDLPDIPTSAEAGVPGQESDLLLGLVAPAGTPKPIIELLQKEVARMVALPDVKQKLGTLGFTPVASTSEAYEAQIKSDLETWSKVVKDLGITVQ